MKLSRWLLIFLSVLLLLFVSVILLRQPILDFVINKAKDKFNERYHAKLNVGDAGFMGFRDVYVSDVSLVPESGDTLFQLKSLKARISISKLLRLHVGFRELIVDSATLSLVKRDSVDNYMVFLKRKKDDSDTTDVNSSVGLNERFSSIYEKINDIFNEQITVRKFKASYRNDKAEEMVSIPELFFDGKIFQSSVITSSVEGVNLWLVNGNADAKNGTYDFSVRRTRGNAFALPFVDLVDGFKVCFDSAQVHFAADISEDDIPLKGKFEMSNLLVNHWRISPNDVVIPKMVFDLNGGVNSDSIYTSTGTVFHLNTLPIKIDAAYAKSPEKKVKLNLAFSTLNAQELFDALPNGMFNTFTGFQAKGELEYHLNFSIPIAHPHDLVFDSKLQSKHFSIVHYGNENFGKINAPFSFLAMDGDRPVRSFLVGDGNPSFTALADISPYLQNCVLTSEDPSFFNHAGFVEESFRESIATNFQKGRFVRGGSTLSMQLVKNVFLSRNKTISRKLEEALIVWLIEQNRIVTKERMFEVYLNIIEWGPNVYGIGEASKFYFEKYPSQLTLAESIYLSSIIPHPKYFRYSFDETGNLKPYMANFYKLVSGRLVKREKIAQIEADSLIPNVKLSGAALNFILPVDTVPVDSLELQEIEQLQIQE
jgi:Transglycosylase